MTSERERERAPRRKDGVAVFSRCKRRPARVRAWRAARRRRQGQRGTQRGLDGRLVAVAQYHPRKGSNISVEARSRRAASVGLAPRLYHINPQRRQLVMELLSGGTLIEIAQRQSGRLHVGWQRRIIELLSRLGLPAEEGARAPSWRCGNPASYVADANGLLHIIDLRRRIARTCRNPCRTTRTSIASLLCIGQGFGRRGWC